MTRINCIPVQELTDKHLVAEYRELPRISGLVWKYVTRDKRQEIPEEYRLGKGHVLFFYDKGLYLFNRLDELVKEMVSRGFKPQYTVYRIHPSGYNNDWIPTESAQLINRERISERLKKKGVSNV